MKIEFEGNNIVDIAEQMSMFLVNIGLGASVPELDDVEEVEAETEVPEVSPGTQEPEREPEPEPEEEPEVSQETTRDPVEDKSEAIKQLMALYNKGKAKEVKALLSDFGVKKFGDVPDEKGSELLEKAEELA